MNIVLWRVGVASGPTGIEGRGCTQGLQGGSQGRWPGGDMFPCLLRVLRPRGWDKRSLVWLTYWVRLTKISSICTWRGSSAATPTSGSLPTCSPGVLTECHQALSSGTSCLQKGPRGCRWAGEEPEGDASTLEEGCVGGGPLPVVLLVQSCSGMGEPL